MKTSWDRLLIVSWMIVSVSLQGWATCGGGGGGGMGGMGGGLMMGPGLQDPVYNVPWRPRVPEAPPATEALVIYWFPSSVEEFKRSSLRSSRILSLYATECVAMEVADAATPLGQKLAPGAKLPIAVLAAHDGTIVGKAENKNGFLRAEQVEKLV